MSDYDWEEPGYEPGIDTGSLGRDAYGYDANDIAQAAADSVHEAYGPIISDYERRVGNVEQLMAGQLAARDMEGARQLQAQDEQLVAEDVEIAKRRLDAALAPGRFDANARDIRGEMETRPGLLPDAALGESPQLYAEAVADHQRQQDQRVSQELAEMQHALDKTHSIREVKRAFRGR